MPVYLQCPECGHEWMIFGKIIVEHGEEVIRIGKFDDICPLCEVQAEIYDVGCDDRVEVIL